MSQPPSWHGTTILSVRKGGKVVVLSHFGRPKGKVESSMSLKPIVKPLSQALGGIDVRFAPDCVGELAHAVVGTTGPLAHPAFVCDVAIGQSTLVTQRVKANLFYRGLTFYRYPIIGDVDGLGLALRCEICGPDGFTPDKATLDFMVEEGMKGDIRPSGRI